MEQLPVGAGTGQEVGEAQALERHAGGDEGGFVEQSHGFLEVGQRHGRLGEPPAEGAGVHHYHHLASLRSGKTTGPTDIAAAAPTLGPHS